MLFVFKIKIKIWVYKTKYDYFLLTLWFTTVLPSNLARKLVCEEPSSSSSSALYTAPDRKCKGVEP